DQTSSQEYELMFRLLQKNATVQFCDYNETIINVRSNSIVRSSGSNRTSEILKNKINLRLEIKEYIRSIGKLTPEVEREVDKYIYERLIKYRTKAPDYVKKFYRENNLKIPYSLVLKYQNKIIIQKIKSFFK